MGKNKEQQSFMNEHEIQMDMSRFLSIEKKYGLYDLEQNGCNYWVYSRFDLWNNNICSHKLQLALSHSEVEKNYAAFFLSSLRSFLSFIRLKKADLLVLNHQRRIKRDNVYCCAYTEEIANQFRHAVVEIPFHYQHFKPVATTNMVTVDYILAISYAYARLYMKLAPKKYRKMVQAIRNETESALNEICQSYQVTLNQEELYQSMAILSIRKRIESFFYDRIVQKVAPKAVVEVVSYEKHCMIINEISKKRNIPVIELQHGTIHGNHAAYHFYPSCGAIAQLPDYLYVFSDFWKTAISWPIDSDKIIPVGYPLFEEELKKYRAVPRRNNKKTILFISQGTIGEMLSQLAIELSKIVNRSEYRVLYKLHPAEYEDWKTRYPWLVDSEVEVLDKRESIYTYFAESDYQVGVYSTAIYEGIGFGLETYIYKVGHYEAMEYLVAKQYAVLFSHASELKDLIERKDKTAPGTKLWKENALNNMKQEISKLIH